MQIALCHIEIVFYFIDDIDRPQMRGDWHWNIILFILKQLLNVSETLSVIKLKQ